ncbi:tRNA lysidine(34) synthetase TilS [Colwellia sp. E2M01]|uniref:tRNA lysidine(34) synthetase TilS n=1 Tax=Colwellia sp. E2M01 TaxID=2841561 RepID=UPI001C082937|nr:tRNA lysidine(34) synthetase TilS [Colwellia sp. E2M01]MBU2869884.1 tRNA lysidine(34) synthetase TilS [Colwellia sp. E2M01]
MDKFTSSLLHSTLKPIFHTHGNIALIIAYSGGVDSQVLLHSLVQLKQQKLIKNDITVCHVNHGLSDNAKAWETFAIQVCAKYNVKLIVKSVNIKNQAQQSLEALARDARYNALKSLSDKPSIILTGHHSDDQSETFLLALKRGAGLKGLSAMSAQSELGQHLLVRPLLNVSRQQIENYAKKNKLSWVEDESNTDTKFDRNFIRQEIMPLLRARWSSINNTINRSAEHCLAGQELLDELAAQDLTICKASENSLHIQPLQALSSARFNNLIRYFMAQHPNYDCLMPSTEQIAQVREQMQAASDKTPEIKVGEHFFRRFKEALHLTPSFNDVSTWKADIPLLANITERKLYKLTLPDNLSPLVFSLTGEGSSKSEEGFLPNILLPNPEQKVSICFSHNNPKCQPHFRQHSRNVKKVLQELAIAPWQRKRIAFLYYDDQLVAALGHFVCKPFIANNAQLSINIRQN